MITLHVNLFILELKSFSFKDFPNAVILKMDLSESNAFLKNLSDLAGRKFAPTKKESKGDVIGKN